MANISSFFGGSGGGAAGGSAKKTWYGTPFPSEQTGQVYCTTCVDCVGAMCSPDRIHRIGTVGVSDNVFVVMVNAGCCTTNQLRARAFCLDADGCVFGIGSWTTNSYQASNTCVDPQDAIREAVSDGCCNIYFSTRRNNNCSNIVRLVFNGSGISNGGACPVGCGRPFFHYFGDPGEVIVRMADNNSCGDGIIKYCNGTVYSNICCVNLGWDGSGGGMPYNARTIPLGTDTVGVFQAYPSQYCMCHIYAPMFYNRGANAWYPLEGACCCGAGRTVFLRCGCSSGSAPCDIVCAGRSIGSDNIVHGNGTAYYFSSPRGRAEACFYDSCLCQQGNCAIQQMMTEFNENGSAIQHVILRSRGNMFSCNSNNTASIFKSFAHGTREAHCAVRQYNGVYSSVFNYKTCGGRGGSFVYDLDNIYNHNLIAPVLSYSTVRSCVSDSDWFNTAVVGKDWVVSTYLTGSNASPCVELAVAKLRSAV